MEATDKYIFTRDYQTAFDKDRPVYKDSYVLKGEDGNWRCYSPTGTALHIWFTPDNLKRKLKAGILAPAVHA